ncbi:hypothetical protein [Prevotella lacticifex]|uniref:hypothetical protein n=1 Tax=Prevotella lacticifex TaxID=2854755 RepID=UPI001CC72FA3|nr:hypothetical protein [Prevotella lacticifex]
MQIESPVSFVSFIAATHSSSAKSKLSASNNASVTCNLKYALFILVALGKPEYILSAFRATNTTARGFELPKTFDNFSKARHWVYLSPCFSATSAAFWAQFNSSVFGAWLRQPEYGA